MKITFTFLVILFLIVNSNSQFQPDVRLTNNSAASVTSFNNAWCVAANGSVVHVVWSDGRDANFEIYYKRSTDSGITWGADTRLTNTSGVSEWPSIAVSGLNVHVVWHDRITSGGTYYKRSTDGGVSWGPDLLLRSNTVTLGSISLALSGSSVHVVWHENIGANYEIYYKRSTDGGTNWGTDTRLTVDSATSGYPCITASGSVVHVVWHDGRQGSSNFEIYYIRSTDGGTTWGAETRLTNNPAVSGYPCITSSGQAVHVVWNDVRDGNNEIYYKYSSDGGVSWGADTRLTNNSAVSQNASLSLSGSNLHLVWIDNRDGNYEVYYKRSTDGGVSWETDTRLTNDVAFSTYASVSASGPVVHVVWQDLRDFANGEIYYKQNPTGNPIGIININSELPQSFSLSQNYPNPFNPKTVISFQLAVNSFASLKVYDLLGREVATLVNEQLQPGTYEVDWDGSGFASGVYYYKLSAGDYTETRKMVLIK